MDCGIPFCHQGCPLGNLIPDWNDFVYRDRWQAASERLHATNNFPEFTGRLCPAPCEGSCVLGIVSDPVTIKAIEVSIADRAFDEGWVTARPPAVRTGKRVAVVGSGPAGLAAADQLNRAGHLVTVLERADRIGGLLRYGIPEFKMEKRFLERRLAVMREEGVVFRTGANVGVNIPIDELRRELRRGGARRRRDGASRSEGSRPRAPGHPFRDGVPHRVQPAVRRRRGGRARRSACDHGEGQARHHHRRRRHRRRLPRARRTARGRAVVHQLELLSRPPDNRAATNPWPLWPNIFRVSSAHEEGGERLYSISTQRFTGDAQGRVTTLHAVQVEIVNKDGRMSFEPVPGSEFELKADLVLLAMGFLGPERNGMLDQLGVRMTDRGNVWRDATWMTSVPGVFTAGDMQRGQSLIVWAIAEGRSAARGVDAFLMGKSDLPAPLQ